MTVTQTQCRGVYGHATFYHVNKHGKTMANNGEHFNILLRIMRHRRKHLSRSRGGTLFEGQTQMQPMASCSHQGQGQL